MSTREAVQNTRSFAYMMQNAFCQMDAMSGGLV